MNKQLLKISKVNDKLTGEPLELSSREREVLSAYLKIRNKYFELHHLEEQGCDSTSEIRAELNRHYGEFVEEFGVMNNTRRSNRNTILKDPWGFMILSSVEVMINREYFPATVLTKSPKGEIEVFQTQNCSEAMSWCLGIHGEVDLKIISDITDKEEDEVIRELGDLVYWSPFEQKFVTADKWLSGNVYDKMIKTKEILDKIADNIEE